MPWKFNNKKESRNFFLFTFKILFEKNVTLHSWMVWSIFIISFFRYDKNLNSVLTCLLNYSDKKDIHLIHFLFY